MLVHAAIWVYRLPGWTDSALNRSSIALGLQERAARAQPHVVLTWRGTRDWMDALRKVVWDPPLLWLRKMKPLVELDSVNCIVHLLVGSCPITRLRFLSLNILASDRKSRRSRTAGRGCSFYYTSWHLWGKKRKIFAWEPSPFLGWAGCPDLSEVLGRGKDLPLLSHLHGHRLHGWL